MPGNPHSWTKKAAKSNRRRHLCQKIKMQKSETEIGRTGMIGEFDATGKMQEAGNGIRGIQPLYARLIASAR